jgi:TonB family protein
MNQRGILALGLGLAISTLAACDRSPTGPVGVFQPVMPAGVLVRLGKAVQFQSTTPGPVERWWVREGPGYGIVSETGLYRAPFIRPTGPTATVVASKPTGEASALVSFSSSDPDTIDCCGPGQDHLPALGDYVYVDDLPVALVRVAPMYPQAAIDAGVEGTVLVHALLCATGQVIEVRVQSSIPLLDAAAVDAVGQWQFSPAKFGGAPVAVWVYVPVKFELNGPALAQAGR